MPPMTLPASAYEGLGLTRDTVNILTRPQPAPASAASPNVLQAEPCSARDLMPNESSITLYAELLLNIRTVTLFASLRTAHTRETKAQLSTDGHTITVSHEGESASIRLPIKTHGGGDAALAIPAHPPSKELSLRLQIEEQHGSELFAGLQADDRNANLVPWDGASLNAMEDATVLCKNCHSVCIPSGRITQWRDLPSENWAEMMDFWHCHKPDEHHLHDHTHEDATGKKGYAAGNRLQATQGVGFVDLTSLLLHGQDCEGIKVGHGHFSFSSPCGRLRKRSCLLQWQHRRYKRPRRMNLSAYKPTLCESSFARTTGMLCVGWSALIFSPSFLPRGYWAWRDWAGLHFVYYQ
jgi:hypothetical protein